VRTIGRIGSIRSISAPARGLSTTAGNRSAKAMMPSQAGEWVSSHVSQPTARRCIHRVISDGTMPAANKK
jgi:hypothetical protein